MSKFLTLFLENNSVQRWEKHGILLAVSGGADSVAMLRCFAAVHHQMSPRRTAFPIRTDERISEFKNLVRSKADVHTDCNIVSSTRIHVAHVNHQLRGEASDGDADFVRALSNRFQFRYHETQLTPEMFEADQSGSIEAAARNLRYKFLQETAERNALRYVAVAHNANDQVETVMHRIIRGTGIAGLAGIPSVRLLSEAVTLIRPFLLFSREQILDYLNECQQSFRTDSTNNESKYTRNRIRNELLPYLQQSFNPKINDTIIRLGQQAAIYSEFVSDVTDQLLDRCVTFAPNKKTNDTGNDNAYDNKQVQSSKDQVVYVDKTCLKTCHKLIVRELFVFIWKKMQWPLQEMGYEQWEKIATIALTKNTSNVSCRVIYFPGKIRVENHQETISLRHELNH